MKIKRVYGNSEKEVLQEVKKEFGEEAVILHIKKKRTGLFGLGKKKVEALVAIDNNMPKISTNKKERRFDLSDFISTASNSKSTSSRTTNQTYSIEQIARKNKEFGANNVSHRKNIHVSKGNSIDNREINELKEMILDLKNEIKKMKTDNVKIPKNLLKIFTYLVDVQELKEEATKEIVMQAAALYKDEDDSKSLSFIFNTISSFISTSQELSVSESSTKIMLMGPTGVGKTTTIAKIAARYSLMKKIPTGLITIDTYRIAAVDQLKVYASIMGLPVEVVYSPSEVPRAISKLSDKRLLLIDTAGRSPNNTIQMSELKAFTNALKIDKKILTLSATMKRHDMVDTIKKFENIGIDGLIFTKLDETMSYGNLIDVVMDFPYPILYFTNGQNIPDDILIGNGKFISQLMLKKYKEDEGNEPS